MKLYIIDTARVEAWENAFIDAIHVCSSTGNYDLGICADDVVFAHTHEEQVQDNSDLVLSLIQCDLKVIKFCKALQESPKNSLPPRIILYSGERVMPAKASCWKTRATQTGGPFAGVPPDRIEVLRDAIPRPVTAERLKVVVEAVLLRMKTSGVTTPAVPNTGFALGDVSAVSPTAVDSFSVSDQLDRNVDSVFAARLIIDACEHYAGNPSNNCHDVTIYRPGLDLVESAMAVIHARNSPESLNAAVEEFLSKLG